MKKICIVVTAIFLGLLVCCDKTTSATPQPPPYTPRTIVMKEIPAGTYKMGDSHFVTLSAFAMQETEVTQGQYSDLMGINPSHFHYTDKIEAPVEQVTWYDAALFCNKLSKKQSLDTVYKFTARKDSVYTPLSGTAFNRCILLDSLQIDYSKKGFRLPTEAEWEYACRGGTTTLYWWGNDPAGKDTASWCFGNSHWSTQAVGTKAKNQYGLYDIAGNVWEWCNDWYGYYDSVAQTNPTGAITQQTSNYGPGAGTLYGRIQRGGSYHDGDNGELKSTYRYDSAPSTVWSYVGFRVAISR